MMIALCASHVESNDYTRLEKLRKMLDSVSIQTVQIELYMSVTGLDDQIVKELQLRYAPWLHITKREEDKLSQFQHYKLLCNEVSRLFDSSIWCMFTDDDDEWHARRAESYLEHIGTIKNIGSIVVCRNGRVHNGHMLEQAIEYFEYATKLFEFQDFFAIATPNMLRLRGCDLIWRNVIIAFDYTRLHSISIFDKPYDVPWLYKQETPKERIEEFYDYVDETLESWKDYKLLHRFLSRSTSSISKNDDNIVSKSKSNDGIHTMILETH